MRKILRVLAAVVALLPMQACRDINITNVVDIDDGSQPSDTTSTQPDTTKSDTTTVNGVGITPVLITVYTGAGCAVPAVTQFSASVSPSTANQGLVWSLNNSTVASIDQNGKATSLSVGVTMVTARSAQDSTKFANATLTVSDQDCVSAERSIDMSPQGASGTAGSTFSLVPICREGTTVVACTPWWYSENVNFVLVDPHTGKLTFMSPGTTQVCVQWSQTETNPKRCYNFTTSGPSGTSSLVMGSPWTYFPSEVQELSKDDSPLIEMGEHGMKAAGHLLMMGEHPFGFIKELVLMTTTPVRRAVR